MKGVIDLKKISSSKIREKKLSFPTKRFFINWKIIIELFFVIIISAMLTTLGIKAVDNSNFLAFLIGNNLKKTEIKNENNQCPSGMVFISSENGGFCFDKYENSPGPACPFQNPQNQQESQNNLDSANCFPVSRENALPWTNISQNQATLACAKAGKRLPSAKEWYLASLGTPDKNEKWESQDCNLNKNWKESPGPTGFGKNCLSSFGVFDMIGNVWEWTGETIFDGKFQNRELPQQGFVGGVDEYGLPFQTDSENPNLNYNKDYFWIYQKGTRSVARGGYFQSVSDGGIFSSYVVFFPSDFSPGIGFRCAK